MVSSVQAGGLKGKQMLDHIIKMEGKILDFLARNFPHSGVIALDVAAAFPSLSRRFLFWVLRRMGIPKWLYTLLRNLHVDAGSYICLRNLLLKRLLVSRGVKQGDPPAMVLFILHMIQ